MKTFVTKNHTVLLLATCLVLVISGCKKQDNGTPNPEPSPWESFRKKLTDGSWNCYKIEKYTIIGTVLESNIVDYNYYFNADGTFNVSGFGSGTYNIYTDEEHNFILMLNKLPYRVEMFDDTRMLLRYDMLNGQFQKLFFNKN